MYSSLGRIQPRLRSRETGECACCIWHSLGPRTYVPRASFPEEHAAELRDMILDVTGRAMGGRKNKVILRKLYVAVRHPLLIVIASCNAVQTR